MDIRDHVIDFIGDTPVNIEICRIGRSEVHYHSSLIEMVFCLEGSVEILCNHESTTLKKGEMFTIGFDDLHCIYSDEDNIVIHFYMDMKQMNIPWETLKYTYFACEDVSCEIYQRKSLQMIKNYILAATYRYVRYGTLDSTDAHTLCHNILDLLMKDFDWFNHINLSPNSNNELRQRFRTIMKYCAENHRNKLTISQLATHVHINENYLSQFIHKSGYGSFNNLIGYMRCNIAQYLLLTSTMPVVDISYKSGFSDTKYLYKYFKAFYNKTPTEFRKWFADYIKIPTDVACFTNDEILPVLEPYIADTITSMIITGIL